MEKDGHFAVCWIALFVAVLAWLPSFALFTPAVFVCFITLPVGLAFARAAPRLAIATVYWSVATLVASPLIVDAPDWLMLTVPIGGLALGVGLPLDYWRRRKLALNTGAHERSGGSIRFLSWPWFRIPVGRVGFGRYTDEPRGEPISGIEAVTDTKPAQWLVDGLEPDWTVCTFVPRGFESYARIFHPAWRVRLVEGTVVREPVTWTDVATVTGRTVHRRMQWRQIVGSPLLDDPVIEGRVANGETVIDDPGEGTLPPSVAKALCKILLPRTRAPEACWFGVWPGFGRDYRAGVPATVSIASCYREWDLFRAPLDAMGWSFFELGGSHQPANVVWADDRSWCLATDIDFDSTYIGGSAELVSAIVGSSTLEAREVKPDDDFIDRINPPGPPPGTLIRLENEPGTHEAAWQTRARR